MAIKIKFDLVGNPEPPTIILANRNGNKLGQLKVNDESIELINKFNDASEFSFTINKYINNKLNPLWDKVVDFKLVYCKEWDCWFEISVELDEETEIVKTVMCTQLGQAELSQIMLYDIEINTERDIERDDYKISILYDENDPKASILDRILEKAPHYSIIHVDQTIANIQRSFSFDNTSIVDAFQEIAEEIGCLFIYNSNSDENGGISRTISVYDLQQKCMNIDCGYRGEFTDVCPKCGSKDIKYGYGDDTLIFVTSDELADSGIQLVTDTDSVKNCFKLEAGDDLMTATIRNCNPNGTDYIWYFSENTKEDMSDELVDKIESYDEIYRDYYDNYESNIDAKLLNDYNALVDKYSVYKKSLQQITTPIKGYPSLMNAYYNMIDLSLYLKSGLMPSIEMIETNAKEQSELLTTQSLSPVAVANINAVSLSTANSAVLAMAKIIVKSTYKVEIKTSEIINNDNNTKTWKGNFVITNYSDEKDTATSEIISVIVNGDEESFIKQKINKALNKEDTDDYSISGLFKKDYSAFCTEIKKYALNPLISFRDACQACIDILIEQGVGNNNTWENTEEGSEGNLYENLYIPYYNKLLAIEAEIKIREDEINLIDGVYDSNDILVSDGLSTIVAKCRTSIQNSLDFEKYLGEKLWIEFCSYRREDKYTNDNYISDGLDNAELFKKANEFIEVAENEIYKSSELQHSISTSLKNLLAIEKFKPLVESFDTGNWIRVQVDDEIYKLRLLEYDIDYGNFNSISVEFSDVTKIKNGITDLQSVISQASSMATSYGDVQRQAKQGNDAKGTISEWLTNGLNSALVQIQNNDTEDITMTKNGLLCRSYSDITETYSPEQFKLTHNILAYTTDNWETVSSALGKHEYTKWQNNQWATDVDYGLTSKFVTAGYVTGSQIIGGEIVSSNYKPEKSGTYLNLIDGNFEFAGGKIVFDTKEDSLTLRNVTIEWENTTKPEVAVKDVSGLGEYLEEIDNLGKQLDGRSQTWYQSKDPSVEWIDDDSKNIHIGDLWHYTGETTNVNGVERIKNSEWIWKQVDGVYQWVLIEVSDVVFDTIDGKAQVFTNTPTPPYFVGDIWVQGSTGDIMHCVAAKSESESYNKNDWKKSSKYTDDSSLTTFIEGDYADELNGIKNQIDGKARSWYQDTDPSLTWGETEDHEGDLWYDTSANSQKTYIYNNGAWRETSVPKELFDTIDGIASIYVTIPAKPVVGDLLIPVSDIEKYKAGKVYRYNGSSWIAIDYVDANDVNNIVDVTKGIAENAKSLGDKLVDGLGFEETEIAGNYVISPVIAGGWLLIGDKEKTYAQISTDGVLTATGANITGDITANSLTLGNGVKISTSNIDGLNSYATTDALEQVKNAIPDSVGDLDGGENILYTDSVTHGEATTDVNGVTTSKITVGNKSFTVIENDNFVLLGQSYGKEDDENHSTTYTCLSTDGLLRADNAIIYGTAVIGGYIQSINYKKDVSGSRINLSDGNFDFGGSNLTYSDNVLALGKKDVDSSINLCGGMGSIAYNVNDGADFLVFNGENIKLEAPNGIMQFVNNPKVGGSYWKNSISLNSQQISISSKCTGTGTFAAIYVNTSDAYATGKGYISLDADYIQIPNNVGIHGLDADSNRYEMIRMGGSSGDPTLVIGDGLYSNNIGNTHIGSSNRTMLLTKNNRIELVNCNDDNYNASFQPVNFNEKNVVLGTSSNRWYAIYAQNATIQTSDIREKENIIPLNTSSIATLSVNEEIEQSNITSELFDMLQPVQYNFINGDGRICYGLIAQHVSEAMKELGLEENDLDLVHHDYWVDAETGETQDSYGIAYANLIAMLIHEVQKLKQKLAN